MFTVQQTESSFSIGSSFSALDAADFLPFTPAAGFFLPPAAPVYTAMTHNTLILIHSFTYTLYILPEGHICMNVTMDIMHHMFCRIANCDNKVRITVAAGVAVCTPFYAMRRPQNSTVKWNTA